MEVSGDRYGQRLDKFVNHAVLLLDMQLRQGLEVLSDTPAADLDTAVASARAHLAAAAADLSPFFLLEFRVGDLVDVVDIDSHPRRVLEHGVKVVAISPHGTVTYEDRHGDRDQVPPFAIQRSSADTRTLDFRAHPEDS